MRTHCKKYAIVYTSPLHYPIVHHIQIFSSRLRNIPFFHTFSVQRNSRVCTKGFELVTDLALADHLINSGVARTVTFQLKSHPTFVSDAMTNDLIATVRHYTSSLGTRYPHCASAGERWTSHLESGRWIANEDRFWVQPSPMWEMTSSLRSDMVKRCDLAFVKGDANYRRLLGDRSWDLVSDSFQDVVGSYFPCPVCALRTLKAEVGCGMEGKKVEMAKKISKDWLVEGRFGVVHYGTGYHAAGATTEEE